MSGRSATAGIWAGLQSYSDELAAANVIVRTEVTDADPTQARGGKGITNCVKFEKLWISLYIKCVTRDVVPV